MLLPLEWIFIEIFVNIIEVSVLFYLLCSKFTAKYKSLIPVILFILGNIIILSLPIFIFFKDLPIAEIFIILTCFLYLYIFRNGSGLKKIFWVLISFSLIVIIAAFVTSVIAVISNTSLDTVTRNSSERLVGLIIAKTLQIVIFYILAKRKKNSEIKNFLSSATMLICFIVPFVSIILLLFIITLVDRGFNISEEIIIWISIGYLITNITVFILYELINKEAEKNYILIAQNKQYELTELHNKQMIEIYEKMREWRHDFFSHLQLISGMLEKSDLSRNLEAINYIKDLDKKIKSTSLDVVTGNMIVDAIISSKATLASAYDIGFKHNIILSDNITIDDTDLCSILSNLLDNAIEACCKLNENRYINIEMLIFKNQFSIKIENSANGEYKIKDGKLKTTKSGDLHGIGMGHVKSIVETYGGIYDIKPELEYFITHISIPLVQKV